MFKKIMTVVALLGAGLAQAFAPQSGTWVVNSEVNGRPGRGFGIDVQNTTMVMQMYAYESNGQPTFYLAVGEVVDNKVTAALNKYTGGRYFGSGDRSGTPAGSPGNVSIRFTSGMTGFITFPGEPEVAISRFNFGYAPTAASLRGVWSFTTGSSAGWLADVTDLVNISSGTSNGNGLVTSSNGLFGCEQQVSGPAAGLVLCVKINTQGQMVKGYYFVYSVNDGEGDWTSADGKPVGALYVKRLINPQGVNTSLVRKSQEQTPEEEALVHHLRNFAEQNFSR